MNFSMSKTGMKVGVFFGVTMFVFACMSMFFGLGTPIVTLMASLYTGYAATFGGAVLGFVWGFVHGYVVGVISEYVTHKVVK